MKQIPGGTRKQAVMKSWADPVRSVMKAIKADSSVLPLAEAALKYPFDPLQAVEPELKTDGLLQ